MEFVSKIITTFMHKNALQVWKRMLQTLQLYCDKSHCTCSLSIQILSVQIRQDIFETWSGLWNGNMPEN